MRPPLPRRSAAAGLALTGLVLLASGLTTATAATAATAAPSLTGSANTPVPAGAALLPSGRLVSPHGTSYLQGDFPLGLAVSPDGVLAAATGVGQGEGTPGGGYSQLCVDGQRKGSCPGAPAVESAPPATGPDEGLFVTNLLTGARTQLRGPKTACVPGKTAFSCFELGVQFAPDGRHVFAVGGGNDAVYQYDVTAGAVSAEPSKVVYLQELSGVAPASSGSYQSPNAGSTAARTKGLAITPNGEYLLVSKEQSGDLDVLRTSDLSLVQRIPFAPLNPTGSNGSVSYPYQVVVAPDGSAAYVTLQGTGLLAVLPLGALGAPVATPLSLAPAVPVGDHPTGLAVSPDGSSLLVANANDDTVTVLDTSTALAPRVTATVPVHALPAEQPGAVPNAVAFASPTRAYVALAGDNALAVLDKGAGGWAPSGYLPTGWYPTGVAVRPGSGQVLSLAAKGFGAGYDPAGGYNRAPLAGGPQAITAGYYDANTMPGLLSVLDAPTASALSDGSSEVRRDLTWTTSSSPAAPAGSPIPLSPAAAGTGPITHVVYIVRENRTYDQVFGDLGRTRNDANADPAFSELAAATPNAHAIASRFATSDSFYSDGEASVQGHWWTAAANTNDYVEKSYRQYYSSRSHSSDEITAPTAFPKGCSLFQAAQLKAAANPAFTYIDYGEPVGVLNPSSAAAAAASAGLAGGSVGSAAGTLATSPCAAVPAQANPESFSSFLGRDDRQFANRFLTLSGLNPDGTPLAGSTAALRNFSYVELPGDHTTGFSPQGAGNIDGHTPRAQIAENDVAVGTIVSALSHSSYWPTTAVFAVEDDSQDGPDHVDGHRNILLVASPYARQQSANGCYPGYISHVHLDQASVVRTVELILGLPALSSYDAGAQPLYDLFQTKSTPAQLTAADLAPYALPAPAPFVEEKVGDPSAGPAATQHALLRESTHLNLTAIDKGGPLLEDVLWRSVRPDAPPAELTARVAAAGARGFTAARVQAAGAVEADAVRVLADPASCALGPLPVVPEAPTAVLLLGSGILLLLAGVWVARRRTSREA